MRSKLGILIKRRDSLLEEAKSKCGDQRHLDADTLERNYWHYGYAVAIKDILNNFVLIDKKEVE